MKKLLALTAICLVFACTTQENDQPELENKLNFVNYSFHGETYKIYFEENKNGELEAVQSETLNRLDEIIERSETLIYHDIDDNNIMLFQNDVELNQYLESIGQPLANASENANKSASFPFDCFNLEIYDNAQYQRPIYWSLNNSGLIDVPCGFSIQCRFQSGSDEQRLKNLATTSNWTVIPQGPAFCFNVNQNLTPPNDKISSVRVRSCFARFYEHANYGGRSITRDARPNGTRWYGDLGKVRYRGKWTNRISSIKLSN